MKTIFLILMQVLLFSAVASAQTTKVVYTCPMHPEVQQSKLGNCPKCGMTLEKKTIKVAAPKTTPKRTVKPPAANTTSVNKQGTTAKKPTNTTKTSTGNDDMREMVKEMRGMMKEMKTTVTELKGIIQEMKGSDEQTDTASTEEHHDHDMNMDNADTSKPVTKQVYTCSMHPEVQSDKAGKCPKCGMTLIRKTVEVKEPNKQTNTQQPQSKVVYTCVMHPKYSGINQAIVLNAA
jgi:uncharacterized Zn finger protein (UPF0148 family)